MIDSFWGNIFRPQSEEDKNIRNILRKIPIFEGLSRKELSAVERILNHREYKSGETIFHQGDPAGGMYIIIRGKIQVIFEPAQQIIAELHDGDFFGELALVDDSPRSATVICRTDSKVLGF
ncbi:MAG: cyclic nucleotide-binding domain-containing protein, partial [candidate division Zixibacteria bacterium]|nr:cyclic nucleotide-binding domain-containing protein [candidate division Zixibacteria bacterium]